MTTRMHPVYFRSSIELVAAPVPKVRCIPSAVGAWQTGAAVDVVGADNGADKLLHQVVLLIGATGGGNTGDSISTAVFLFDGSQALGDVIVNTLPTHLVFAVALDHGSAQALGWLKRKRNISRRYTWLASAS